MGCLFGGGIGSRRVGANYRELECGDCFPEARTFMKKYKFKARIEEADMGTGGAFVFFPYDVAKEFGTKGRVPVKATFDGAEYSGSLVKYGNPLHMLGLLKAIREKIGKGPGDTIEVVVWRDEAERVVAIPATFKALLKKEGLLAGFEKLSFTHRKEYVRWIEE